MDQRIFCGYLVLFIYLYIFLFMLVKVDETAVEDASEGELIDPLADVDAGFSENQKEVDTSINHLLDIKVESEDH